MTGRPPPAADSPDDGHLPVDALADVLAGERLDGEHGGDHLDSCATCGERLAALSAGQAEVVAALARLPEPALPDGLEARLASALRAADVDRDARAASRRATVTPLTRRPGRAWVPAAAASLVLVLGGAMGWALLDGGVTGAGDATTAAGGTADSGTARDEAAVESAEEPAEDSARSSGPAGATSMALPPRSATGADYADATQRAAALPQVLAGGPVASAEQGGPGAAALPPAGGALARLDDPQELEGCLSAVTQGGPAPLALDAGRFEDGPALAVVLPSAEPDEVVVHVVGPGCAADDADTLLVAPAPRP